MCALRLPVSNWPAATLQSLNLEKEITHPIPSGWPFLLIGCGGGPFGVCGLPAHGVCRMLGFLPTVLVPVCLTATSLQIKAVAGAGTTQYCFYCLCPRDW